MSKQVKEYKAKTLFNGSVIGKPGMFVAIPEKGFKGKTIRVIFDGRYMIIDNWLNAQGFRRFPDKWGRGTYTLGYFEWKPAYDPVVDQVSPLKVLHDHLKQKSQQQLALD